MADSKNLDLTREGQILKITINRESRLNALDRATLGELKNAIQEIYDDNEIKGALITGAGEKAFVAGADISEIQTLSEVNGRKYSEYGQEIFHLIENCDKPIIAAINGYALGGGCELAMACHIRVAVEAAMLGQPEVKLGIIPGYGGTQRLTQLIGKGKALELLMTGDSISAQEARDLGLVNHVVSSQEELLPLSNKILSKIIAQAPLAVGMMIDCVNAVFEPEDGYQTEANSFANCCKSDDFREGSSAFLAKRKPEFKGA